MSEFWRGFFTAIGTLIGIGVFLFIAALVVSVILFEDDKL